jgi:hypothetical protein
MAVLQQALELVSPSEVILFSLPLVNDSLKGFLTEIAQQIKKSQGAEQTAFSLLHLAGILGHTVETVLAGLRWWQLRGDLVFSINGDQVTIIRSNSQPSLEIHSHTLLLQDLLKESAAFRSYYRRADPSVLLGWTV